MNASFIAQDTARPSLSFPTTATTVGPAPLIVHPKAPGQKSQFQSYAFFYKNTPPDARAASFTAEKPGMSGALAGSTIESEFKPWPRL